MTQVHCTRDYNKFKLLRCNRPIRFNGALERSMRHENKLHLYPITVDREFNIIDGQHRFDIARRHNLDLYYQVDEHAEIDAIPGLQTGRAWSLVDFLHFYLHRGVKIYEQIYGWTRSGSMGLTTFLEFFVQAGSRDSAVKLFKRGAAALRYSHADTQLAVNRYEEASKRIRGLSGGKMSKNAQKALLSIILDPAYCHDTMMDHLHKYPDYVVEALAFNSAIHIRDRLVQMYNHKLRGRKRL